MPTAGSVWSSMAARRVLTSLRLQIMFIIGIVMFTIATVHLAMNCYRMINGYVIHAADAGGPVGYISALSPWHHVFKDTLYATQEIMGDTVAVYRTWVIWGRDWRAVVLPCALIIASTVSGYAVCGLYPSEKSDASIFDPRLLHWITAFYAVSFVQSFLTTSLMAYRIWQADRRSAKFRASEGSLLPVLRILVESAALQLVVEFVLLVLYAANENAQYILLELVTPLVAITFNAITIRIAFRSSDKLSLSRSSQQATSAEAQVATIGSIPMRPIAINIRKDVEAHGDGRSENGDFQDGEMVIKR
ncbi:hypothetical protein EIP86_006212 [Pleurotus ostreatoroseus]|nr:hypothetical protein EIP86_006212 [Pleurotus ostreatoroseus]